MDWIQISSQEPEDFKFYFIEIDGKIKKAQYKTSYDSKNIPFGAFYLKGNIVEPLPVRYATIEVNY